MGIIICGLCGTGIAALADRLVIHSLTEPSRGIRRYILKRSYRYCGN